MVVLSTSLQRRWWWAVTVVCMLNGYFVYGIVYSYGVLFGDLQTEFDSSTIVTGWVQSLCLACGQLFSVPGQMLVIRFGYFNVIISAVFIYSLCLLLSSFVPSIIYMYITYGLGVGITTGVSTKSFIQHSFEWAPVQYRVRASTLATLGGLLTISPVLGTLLTRLGWRWTLRICSGLVFVMGLIIAPVIYITPKKKNQSLENTDVGAYSKVSQRDGDVEKETESYSEVSQGDGDFEKETKSYSEVSQGDVDVEKETKSYSEVSQGDGDVEKETKSYSEVSLGDGNVEKETESYTEVSQRRVNVEKEMKLYSEVSHGSVEVEKQMKDSCPEVSQLELTIDEKEMESEVSQRDILRIPETWLFGLMCAIVSCATGFTMINLVDFSTKAGFTLKQGTLILSINGGAEVIGKVCIASFIDKLHFHKILIWPHACIVGAVSCIFLLYVTSFEGMLIVSFAFGIVKAVFNATPYVVASEVFPPKYIPSAASLGSVPSGIGFLLAALLGGFSYDYTGSYDSALYACSGLYLIGCALALCTLLWQKMCAVERFRPTHGIKQNVTDQPSRLNTDDSPTKDSLL
ncbi:uncharacterized protein [Antedon mediterranea]|uniref:uncharacterized protein isoform X2 n=1 Tax=Antedon mediterranea TaxID=105859 RepID=UPI003AF47E9F